MKIPKILSETNIFMKNQILGCPGRNVRAATIEKTIGITVLSARQRRRAQNW